MPATRVPSRIGLVAGADAPLERAHEVRIAAGHQGRGQFHYADARAERVVDAGQLKPNDSAADHQQAAGELRQLERIGGIDDARILRQPRQAHRLGARGDDALLEAGCARSPEAPITSSTFGLTKRPLPRSTSTLRCLASTFRPPVSLATTWLFHVRSLARSIAGAPNAMPRAAISSASSITLARVQQRLGGNAADVQAHAAELLPALDEGHLQSQVRRAKGRRVAAGAGAEHQQLCGAREASRWRDGIGRARGPACAPCHRRPRQGCGAAVGAAAAAGAADRAPRVAAAGSRRAMSAPLETLSPRLSSTSVILPGGARGHVHRGLVGLERDERSLQLDHVAGLHQHVDDRRRR